jgi:hypothetical protein
MLHGQLAEVSENQLPRAVLRHLQDGENYRKVAAVPPASCLSIEIKFFTASLIEQPF